MKFELLPNEILIECFGYLNALYIYYSFDQLNSRFNKLIRNIPLHLDFQNIYKLICDQFCKKMLSDHEIKKQIYSVHLSNKNTSQKIHQFLSFFSLDEFIHLQSLTLTEIKSNDVSHLTLVLPLLSQLSCFRLINSTSGINEIFSELSISQLQTIKIAQLPIDLEFKTKLSLITNFTISYCYLNELCDILNNASNLKYLKVEQIIGSWIDTSTEDGYCVTLKRLIILSFEGQFDDLAIILKQTPNLKNLTITAYNSKNLIDACQWEQLITSSLLHLQTFKFIFQCSRENDGIEEKFKEFQSDFWCKEHHWFIEYILSKNSASIYTIPYISNTFELKSYNDRYSQNTNTFQNVTHLTIYPDVMIEKSQFHFSHVTSMTLQSANSLLTIQHIKYLKMIVNLFNIKHLTISYDYHSESALVLLEILKHTSQISSITIGSDNLILLLDNDELCKYFKMIKQLYISNYSMGPLDTIYELNRFCKIFSNLEELRCTIYDGDSLLFLSKNLSKLKCINIYSRVSQFHHKLFWLAKNISRLDKNMFADFDENYYTELTIWVIKNIN